MFSVLKRGILILVFWLENLGFFTGNYAMVSNAIITEKVVAAERKHILGGKTTDFRLLAVFVSRRPRIVSAPQRPTGGG